MASKRPSRFLALAARISTEPYALTAVNAPHEPSPSTGGQQPPIARLQTALRRDRPPSKSSRGFLFLFLFRFHFLLFFRFHLRFQPEQRARHRCLRRGLNRAGLVRIYLHYLVILPTYLIHCSTNRALHNVSRFFSSESGRRLLPSML